MVIGADGARDYRPVEDIRVGDHVAIAAGDRIPVDGLVIAGETDLDMSIVNGESAPVAIRPGAVVQAGTLSLTGSLSIEATATAQNSFLSEIIHLMEAAEGGRARYRRIADRAARYYSPAVHFLAIAAFITWGHYDGDWKHAMMVAIAVLIITCPCALGLAVPVVQVVAAGRLFKAGIMVKDGSAMERLAEIDMVAFDKTGTLTLGRPRLIDGNRIEPAVFAIAAGLAAHSRHPLSQALWSAYGGQPLAFASVREVPGAGVEAQSPAGLYRLGNRRFACADANGNDDANVHSEVVLSLNGAEMGAFHFEDMLRPRAETAIRNLKASGLTLGILSGDRAPVVARLATQLGIERWRAELSPREKAEACAFAADNEHRLLMVGDGINDAPALAAAHVSMAPATAADVGRQAADFVFMRDGLDAVPFAIEASRRAGRLIRENFVLAIGYNVIAVPIALLGYATPLIASIAMSTSSLIVVANALRLNRLAMKQEGEAGSVDTLADTLAATAIPAKDTRLAA